MLSSPSKSTAQYKRIRMISGNDFQHAYHLIPAYIENPHLALSVEEAVIGMKRGYALAAWLRAMRGGLGPSTLINTHSHSVIKKYIRELGLGANATRQMLDSLDWWTSGAGVQATPSGTSDDDTIAYESKSQEKYQEQYHAFADTTTALLLSLCQNIDTIYLWTGLTMPGPLRDYLFASNYGLTPRPCLQRLRHVQYLGMDRDDERYYETVDFLDIFKCVHRLPQIDSISMDSVTDYNTTTDEVFPPKTSKGLKRMHLGHVDIDPDMLATILRIPVGLEELSLSFGGLFYPDSGMPNIDPVLLSKALRQHKDTLRVLDLDVGAGEITVLRDNEQDDDEMEDSNDYGTYYEMDIAASEGPLRASELQDDHTSETIGSLQDYAALTRLSIGIEFILGRIYPGGVLCRKPEFRLIDTLPPNLEFLCLYGYERGKNIEIDAHVMELMNKRLERLPKLTEVLGVEKTEPGIFIKPEGWPFTLTEESLWVRPKDSVEPDWLEA